MSTQPNGGFLSFKMPRRLVPALLLALLVAIAALTEGFHHHDDGLEHDDCTACALVLHSGSSVASPEAAQLPVPVATFTLLSVTIALFGSARYLGDVLGRSPPFPSL